MSKSKVSLLKLLKNITERFGPYIPFTGSNTIWRSLSRVNRASVLDIGCAKGDHLAVKLLSQSRNFIVGLDIFLPYLRECKKGGIYAECVLGDATKLPFKEKSFDIVLCFEILEHLEKEEGWQLLEDIQQLARKKVIITTHVGFTKQQAYDANPHQEHRSPWNVDELKKFGFKVRGYGLPNLVQEGSLFYGFWRIFNFLYILVGPFTFLFPKLSGHMVAIKTLGSQLK